MRPRKEIEEAAAKVLPKRVKHEQLMWLQLEALLDIRDLLVTQLEIDILAQKRMPEEP